MIRRYEYNEGSIKEFNNHALHVKADKSILEDIKAGHTSATELFTNLLDSLDCYIIGDEKSLGNWGCYQTVYCTHNNKCYNLTNLVIEKEFSVGKTVILYPHNPDDDEQAAINEWLDN